MTEPKWTPGPWRAVINTANFYDIVSDRDGDIADTCQSLFIYHNGVELPPADAMVIQKANARLIAAAPELYEAAYELRIDAKIMAESALHAAKTDPRWEGVYEKLMVRIRAIEAALAEASGE